MARRVLWLSVLVGLAVFGACTAIPSLLRLGVPFPLSALGLGLLAGVALYMLLHTWLAPPMSELADFRERASGTDGGRGRPAGPEADASGLRHDLRDALSPALPVVDRLLAHADPDVRRAGRAVSESIERATDLLAATRRG